MLDCRGHWQAQAVPLLLVWSPICRVHVCLPPFLRLALPGGDMGPQGEGGRAEIAT